MAVNEAKIILTAKDETAAAFASAHRGLLKMTDGFSALGRIAGVGLGVSAFVGLVKSSIDAQDRLLDLSKTTRLSVEDLSGLASAAKKSGSDLDGTAKAINKLAVEMGKDSEKFAALGINAKSPLEAFGQLADVLNAIEDPQKRAAAASIALGKSWQDSAPLLEEGGKGIRELIARGKELSKITTESAKRADEFNDRWEDMKSIAAGWGTAIADPIVKGLLKIGNALNMEIDRAPGSIAEFLLGPKAGYTGPLDQYGLPAKPGAPKVASPTPPKPSARAVDKFINGEAAGKTSKAANDLKRLIELGQRNQAELIDSEEEQRILATTRAMRDAAEEFQALQRIIKVGEDNELAAYYETAGEEVMRLVAEQQALKTSLDESTEFVREAARNIQDALGDGLFDLMQGNFSSIGKSFKTMLDRMVANAIAADIGKYLLGDIGKTGEVGGLAAKLLDFLPKFAMGTPYVPETGLAVVHQGERIIPAAENRGGWGGNIIIHVNGAGNAQDVRRAAGQGAREALAAFAGAQRYG